MNRYIRSLEELAKRINVRKYKNKTYTQDQIDKAASKYTSVRQLVDIQLSGTDGNLILSFKVNAEQLDLEKQRDGRYLLATNRPLTEQEMLLHFKRQDRIEKHVHTFKGPLQVRPMFLHKQERIESLVLICMLALLVFSILETLAKRANILMTAESILKLFQTPLVVYTIFKDGSCFKKVAPLTQFQSAFIHALNLPDPGIYLKLIMLE